MLRRASAGAGVAVGAAAVLALASCGTGQDGGAGADAGAVSAGTAGIHGPTPSTIAPTGPGSGATPPAPRAGRTAQSQRARFIPQQIVLPDGTTGGVDPASTVAGELVVPDGGDRVGWWDGGAWIGDPFGSTVLAGHVDTLDGVGVLAALTTVSVGDRITVRGGQEDVVYEVTKTELVRKDVLSTETDAFAQRGPHRLVLITCWGDWDPEARSYESNLVVTAAPDFAHVATTDLSTG